MRIVLICVLSGAVLATSTGCSGGGSTATPVASAAIVGSAQPTAPLPPSPVMTSPPSVASSPSADSGASVGDASATLTDTADSIAVNDLLALVGTAQAVRVELRTGSGQHLITDYSPPESMHAKDLTTDSETIVMGTNSWQRTSATTWVAVSPLDAGAPETKLTAYAATQLATSATPNAGKRYAVDFGDGLQGTVQTDAKGRLARLELWTADTKATPDVSTYTYDIDITVTPPPGQ